MSTAPRRILEIGPVRFFALAFPGVTTFFDTSPHATSPPGAPRNTVGLRRALRGGAFDLVVCHASRLAPWSLEALVRTFGSRKVFSGLPSPARAGAPRLAAGVASVPIIAVDLEDHSYVASADLPLLDACLAYFKRELPVDPWRVFTRTATNRLPSGRFRQRPEFRDRVAKLRPIALGLPPAGLPEPTPAGPKSADIFFAGSTAGLPLREQGVRELMALQTHGVVVDCPSERLERDAFYERCAGAWLTFSPEGLGWECFRHYEAAALGSVPVINYPSILRYAPLQPGVHCLFYSPEPGGLTGAVLAALRDKDRLAAMARRAAAFVRQTRTLQAMCRHMLAECGFDVSAAGLAAAPAHSQG